MLFVNNKDESLLPVGGKYRKLMALLSGRHNSRRSVHPKIWKQAWDLAVAPGSVGLSHNLIRRPRCLVFICVGNQIKVELAYVGNFL